VNDCTQAELRELFGVRWDWSFTDWEYNGIRYDRRQPKLVCERWMQSAFLDSVDHGHVNEDLGLLIHHLMVRTFKKHHYLIWHYTLAEPMFSYVQAMLMRSHIYYKGSSKNHYTMLQNWILRYMKQFLTRYNDTSSFRELPRLREFAARHSFYGVIVPPELEGAYLD